MNDAFLGGCSCGGRRYAITRKFLNAMHCHCRMCRLAHGAGFSTHVIVRPDQFRWTHDASALIAFESSPEAFREFCAVCGTHVLVHGQTGDDTLAIPAGTLDDPVELTVLGHMFVGDRAPWVNIEDDLPQHAQWPPGFGPAGDGR